MKNLTKAELVLIFEEGVRELVATLDKDLQAVAAKCKRRHVVSKKRMKNPMLSVWADCDEHGKVGIFVHFEQDGQPDAGRAMQYSFPRASYREMADMLEKLRPMICTPAAVAGLVQDARPRMIKKFFGVAA